MYFYKRKNNNSSSLLYVGWKRRTHIGSLPVSNSRCPDTVICAWKLMPIWLLKATLSLSQRGGEGINWTKNNNNNGNISGHTEFLVFRMLFLFSSVRHADLCSFFYTWRFTASSKINGTLAHTRVLMCITRHRHISLDKYVCKLLQFIGEHVLSYIFCTHTIYSTYIKSV